MSRAITPETRVSLKAGQFWGLIVVVGGAAGWLSTQSAALASLRNDHDREVLERQEADRGILASQERITEMLCELTRELDRKRS